MTYKEARQKAGLTIDAAATQIGVSRNAIWLWENYRGNPTVTNLAKMAEVYGVPVSKLEVVVVPPEMWQRGKKEMDDGD